MSVLSVTLLVALAAISGAQRLPGAEYRCVPNSSFKADDGCNDCVCNAEGTNAGCTLKLCISRNKREAVDPSSPDFKCEPNSSFRWQCNDCQCSPQGVGARCTRRVCAPGEERRKRALADNPSNPDFQCTPNSDFKWECNDCKCSSTGVGARCTRRACPHDRKRRSVLDPSSPDYSCEPEAEFSWECNRCKCSNTGKGAACTRKACPQQRKRRATQPKVGDPDFTCTPGDTFMDDCNSCTCMEDGKSAGCTDMACDYIPHRNRRDTTPRVGQPGFTCTPGESFKDDCNDCTCTNDGRNAFCTLKACLHKRDVTNAEGQECQEGETKKQDCNTCTCFNGKFGCTKIGCPKFQKISKRDETVEKEFTGTSCAPNDKFMIDCNTCYCNADGSGYSCTEQLCIQNPPKKR